METEQQNVDTVSPCDEKGKGPPTWLANQSKKKYKQFGLYSF